MGGASTGSGAQALAVELDAEEGARFPFDTGAIDWTEYLEGTRLPRLHEMVTEAFAARAARDHPA